MTKLPAQVANEPVMPDPIAYFLTWTTYGTWLPGDERGWVRKGRGFQSPNLVIERIARQRMTEPSIVLRGMQRSIVEETIREHCRMRSWFLHEVRCGTNHVHVVVTAEIKAKKVRDQLKAWCTRKLKEHARGRNRKERQKWWTEGGSCQLIPDEEGLEAVIRYVRECQ